MSSSAMRYSPAAERNRGPIGEALLGLLPAHGHALEIASGSGQHAAWFGALLPGWHWQPTDADDGNFASVRHWCAAQPNVAPPFELDLLALPADLAEVPVAPDSQALVFCANMLHISPWPTCDALMRLAATVLQPEGQLIVYGPFIIEGEPLAPSNAAFDEDLRQRDPAWGLRRLAAVQQTAAKHGLLLAERRAMPANNQLLVWRRA
ncbi:MAG TPA: DUF938 domain-containing protein [Ideonella sp.]|uniref:DUF938 domain-containing protein n=1 Tax=Ideonella sp. TaxID=1929293 RepID=UPI002C659407|nr:DUF938 domain-containing protein [Ideonella sp.]HSI52260.1 DUF938 domain-containing protein [Ideonella sp.]